jgi:hypothetical protein
MVFGRINISLSSPNEEYLDRSIRHFLVLSFRLTLILNTAFVSLSEGYY